MSDIENQILVHVHMYIFKILTLHTGPPGTELSERSLEMSSDTKRIQLKKKIATGKEWNKLLKILSLESNDIFLIFCNCKVHDLGIFILQVCII